MLPRAIVDDLKAGKDVTAESFEEATIFFSGGATKQLARRCLAETDFYTPPFFFFSRCPLQIL